MAQALELGYIRMEHVWGTPFPCPNHAPSPHPVPMPMPVTYYILLLVKMMSCTAGSWRIRQIIVPLRSVRQLYESAVTRSNKAQCPITIMFILSLFRMISKQSHTFFPHWFFLHVTTNSMNIIRITFHASMNKFITMKGGNQDKYRSRSFMPGRNFPS